MSYRCPSGEVSLSLSGWGFDIDKEPGNGALVSLLFSIYRAQDTFEAF